MKKKILVIYARYGSGHKSIAEYVAHYIEEHNTNAEVLLLDMTPYGNRLGNFGVKLMDWVCRKRSELIFNTAYEISDHKLLCIGNNLLTKKSYDNKKLRKILIDFDPDITISSHFFCSGIITYYNKLGLIKSKLLTIITDYRVHEWWIKNKKYEDGYIVGNEIVKEELIKRGVDAKKIYPFGLPLNISQINKLDDNEVIYKRYDIKGNRKVYLFFGGSTMGSMYYYDYFKVIAKMHINADIIFVSGKNNKLKSKCEEFIKKNNIKNIKVLGYSNDVFNLMKISDIVISKPGGATVTECLEMKVPMILVPGMGGQEKYNARFMAKKKYGIKVSHLWTFKRLIRKIENNPSIINKMRERLKRQNNNKSVEKINNLVNKW